MPISAFCSLNFAGPAINSTPFRSPSNRFDLPVLGEPDVSRSLPEALTADVEAVFANETSSVCADAALASALAVATGAREPDGLVRHDGGRGFVVIEEM